MGEIIHSGEKKYWKRKWEFVKIFGGNLGNLYCDFYGNIIGGKLYRSLGSGLVD